MEDPKDTTTIDDKNATSQPPTAPSKTESVNDSGKKESRPRRSRGQKKPKDQPETKETDSPDVGHATNAAAGVTRSKVQETGEPDDHALPNDAKEKQTKKRNRRKKTNKPKNSATVNEKPANDLTDANPSVAMDSDAMKDPEETQPKKMESAKKLRKKNRKPKAPKVKKGDTSHKAADTEPLSTAPGTHRDTAISGSAAKVEQQEERVKPSTATEKVDTKNDKKAKSPRASKPEEKRAFGRSNRRRSKDLPVETHDYVPTSRSVQAQKKDIRHPSEKENVGIFETNENMPFNFAPLRDKRARRARKRSPCRQTAHVDKFASKTSAERPNYQAVPPPPEHYAPSSGKKQHGETREKLVAKKPKPSQKTDRSHPQPAERPPPEKYVHPDDKIVKGMRRRPRFAPFLSPDEIEKQIKKDALYRGILRINKRNRSDAYVTCENLEGDIYIHRERDRNRALEGDLVAVRLLDVDKVWKSKVERDRKKKEEKDGISAIQLEEEDKTKSKYCGQVVGIISRAESQTVAGTLFVNHTRNGGSNGKEEKPEEDVEEQDDEEPVDDEVDGKQVNNGNERSHENIRLAWFKPTDKRTPLVAIPIRHVPADFLENQEKYNSLILLAKITRWPIDSQHPFGKIERELGPVGNVKVETEAILADNNIKEVPFTDKALKGLPETPWKIPQGEYQKRRDLREYRIFTIDPATARDLDDALHIKPLENGQFEVGVHIADVSHFVRDHTPLDTEARSRGTSTYLVDRVIPMLPSLLCEELCSLNPGVERLAFSVIWKMDGEGNVLETWFGKSIIKSCAKLAYSDAQSVIEGGELPITATVQNHEVNAVKKDILHLYQLSKHMRKRRFDNGALSIGSVRLSFTLDDDNEPDSVNIYETKEANHLIEEFMLRANMSVAEKICQQYPSEALLRRHAPPIERRLEEFLRQTEELGYPFEGHSAGALQASFDSVESEDVKAVLRILAIKPMQRAKYFCTGSIDIAKYLHFALNVPLYTHFTSPIRRYADVMVHRQLQAALLNKEHCGYTMKTVQSVALQCNRKKDGAKNAQDQHIQLYLSRFLYRLQETQGPIVRSAIVLLVAKDAFEIFVPEYALEKRIYTDSLPLEREAFNATDMSLSIYWKEGAVLNRETADQIRRENDGKKSESDDSDREANGADDYVEEAEDDAEGPLSGKTALKIPDNMLEENRLDDKTRMQYLKAFTRLDVLIQVDMDRSPPVVHIYPVNPFLKK